MTVHIGQGYETISRLFQINITFSLVDSSFNYGGDICFWFRLSIGVFQNEEGVDGSISFLYFEAIGFSDIDNAFRISYQRDFDDAFVICFDGGSIVPVKSYVIGGRLGSCLEVLIRQDDV